MFQADPPQPFKPSNNGFAAIPGQHPSSGHAEFPGQAQRVP